ncbi:MAG: hypothetical protein N2171_03620 [Clostridia bacterium]|nr:hypothetical protein [Clostridia bacterium]
MAKYYVFAIFVFMLCLLLIFAVKLLLTGKEKDDKNEKLLRLYRQIEDMLDSFEEYVEEIKREFADEKERIMRYMEEMKISEKKSSSKETLQTEAVPAQNINKAADKEKLSKNEMVKKLYGEGMEINDIAKKLNMTTSEIKLIIDLNS